jgi:hypothetical protein
MSETIRREVHDFVDMGSLPDSHEADEAHVARLEIALMKISPPVSEEEAVLLAAAFGPDECFGLAWTLVHLIESAPRGAPIHRIPISDNQWIRLLRERAGRS